ncbi:DNA repair protein RecN [Halorhodospira halochloris]|uniref:DNA repair protein RecN n=1 Tax=Halorhodospira halochloris TaxID=1052 RepID=UPI001EE89185|nr:DNA repair protein RecN [Halorhodospira halochloris]MCG5531060.1 DNA repair protein RecN [Halorhodospira halochloris]
MLREIHIRNFTIVEELDLELGAGMNVLTGETGAGKSILLDAIGLCLGDRATADVIRPGSEKAEITAIFDPPSDSGLSAWLTEQELTAEDELIIRRVIQKSGRSRGYINGVPVGLQMLRSLGEHLIDIHGQHAHQSLLRANAQRALLDGFANTHQRLPVDQIAELYRQLKTIDRELDELSNSEQNYEDRLALLRYQVEELDSVVPGEQGIAEVENEHRRLAHAEELLRQAHSQLDNLGDDEQSAQALIGRALRELEEQRGIDPSLNEACELFETALTYLQEGCQALRSFTDTLEPDPQRLAELDQKISDLRDLARKHRVEVDELPETLSRLQNDLYQLENAEQRIAELRQQRDEVLENYRRAAAELSALRQHYATTLAAEVGELLGELGMAGAELIVAVEHNPEGYPTAHGLDHVELKVRTNPGQPPGPLAKVASGGELSRLGLALQVATVSGSSSVPTLIFDEADTGIGGAVAEVVGRLLRTLGQRYQVLCVTHLPQVASQASHHFNVAKTQDEQATSASVSQLDDDGRIEELARMLGGLQISDHERGAAREMLQRGTDRRL